MKKYIIIIILFSVSFSLQAQLVFTSQGNGIVDVAYGNNYSLFDPQGSTEVYVYLWIDANQTAPNLSGTYNDEWNNASGLVVLTYSATENKFLGQIDFNTHNFHDEGVIPQGTQINEFNFILRNQSASSQTGNELASSYGFTVTTTAEVYDTNSDRNNYFSEGFLHLPVSNSIYHLQIFSLSGQLLNDIKTKESVIDLTFLKHQYIILKVSCQKKSYFVKKIQI